MSETTHNLRAAGFVVGWSLISFGSCLMAWKYSALGAALSNLEYLLTGATIVGGVILVYVSYFGLVLPRLKAKKRKLRKEIKSS